MFEFRKLEDPADEGSCRIHGALLDQLKRLERGFVLQLTGQDGKRYAIVNWDDLKIPTHPTPGSPDAAG